MGWQDDAVISAPAWQQDEIVKPERSFMGELGHQAGLTGRYAIEGMSALPAMIADAPARIINAGTGLWNMATGGNVSRIKPIAESIPNWLTQAGFPEPETAGERVIGDASRAVAGVGAGLGLGATLPQKLSAALTARPAMQAASAATGGVAGGLTRESGGGPAAQLSAALVGSTVPGLAVNGVPAATRFAFRGGEANLPQIRQNIGDFESSGTSPTVGQATGGRVARATESILSKSPGGAGPMVAKANDQQSGIGQGLYDLAATLSPKSSATLSGRTIERGISGDGGFIDQFKQQQQQLYNALDQHIPSGTRIDVSNTKNALADLNAGIPGAPNVSAFFKNAKIQGIEGALKADTEGLDSILARPDIPDQLKQLVSGVPKKEAAEMLSGFVDGKLPYEALKKLRTLVGNEMADSTFASDVPRSKWTRLYAALSDDLGNAAQERGPQATQTWQRANWYTRAGMDRIDALRNIVERAGGPENIFQAATSGTREGATTLRGVMQSLPEDGQKLLSATVIRRLGMAGPGAQNDLGDAFSTNAFLTNWNKLSPEAKTTLFGRFGPQFASDMDRIARVASNLRQGSQVFANPSGTAQVVSAQSAGLTALGALATGHPMVAAGVGAGVAGGNIFARLMTNPTVVHWLAESSKVPSTALPVQINLLSQMGAKNKDAEVQQFADWLREATTATRK